MTIEYKLGKEDFLTYQLYSATKSESVRKSRNKARIRVPIVYVILSLLLYVFTDTLLAGIFLAIGILWYFLSPFYLKRKYITHYSKYIDEHYKNRFGVLASLTFNSDTIESKDITGESKLNLSEVEEINEIKDYFFIKISSGVSLILPKDRIPESEKMEETIKTITEKHQIKHNVEFDWKWK